jgi:hypothetical protein
MPYQIQVLLHSVEVRHRAWAPANTASVGFDLSEGHHNHVAVPQLDTPAVEQLDQQDKVPDQRYYFSFVEASVEFGIGSLDDYIVAVEFYTESNSFPLNCRKPGEHSETFRLM